MAFRENLSVNILSPSTTYTVATLPSVSDVPTGSMVYCSNGTAGSPGWVWSNGTNWLTVVANATAATS